VSFFNNFFVSHTHQGTGPISDDGSGILSFRGKARYIGILGRALDGARGGRSYLFPSPTSSTRTDSKRPGAGMEKSSNLLPKRPADRAPPSVVVGRHAR